MKTSYFQNNSTYKLLFQGGEAPRPKSSQFLDISICKNYRFVNMKKYTKLNFYVTVSVNCRPKLANSSEDIFFEAFVLLLISLIQLCGINVHLPLLQDFCLLKCFSSDYGIGNILLELLQFLRIQPFKKFICSYFMRQVFLFMFPLKKYTGFLLHFRH